MDKVVEWEGWGGGVEVSAVGESWPGGGDECLPFIRSREGSLEVIIVVACRLAGLGSDKATLRTRDLNFVRFRSRAAFASSFSDC